MMGHVNNAVYFTYMEEARIAFVDSLMSGHEIPLILAGASVNYRAQTFFGQTLVVSSWLSRLGNSSFDISCQMHHEDSGELAFDAVATIVYFDYESGKPVRIPDELRAQMEALLE